VILLANRLRASSLEKVGTIQCSGLLGVDEFGEEIVSLPVCVEVLDELEVELDDTTDPLLELVVDDDVELFPEVFPPLGGGGPLFGGGE
jgi:hypothetical protein